MSAADDHAASAEVLLAKSGDGIYVSADLRIRAATVHALLAIFHQNQPAGDALVPSESVPGAARGEARAGRSRGKTAAPDVTE